MPFWYRTNVSQSRSLAEKVIKQDAVVGREFDFLMTSRFDFERDAPVIVICEFPVTGSIRAIPERHFSLLQTTRGPAEASPLRRKSAQLLAGVLLHGICHVDISAATTPFLVHIPHIIGLATQPQMGRITTKPVIAGMHDDGSVMPLPVRNGTVYHFPRRPVGENFGLVATARAQNAIAGDNGLRRPQPALIITPTVNLTPKPVAEGCAGSWPILYSPRLEFPVVMPGTHGRGPYRTTTPLNGTGHWLLTINWSSNRQRYPKTPRCETPGYIPPCERPWRHHPSSPGLP